MTKKTFHLFCFFVALVCCFAIPTFGLQMKGIVYDRTTNKPIEYAVVLNTFTGDQVETDSNGKFTMTVELGHLIEFRKLGYAIARVRIETKTLPYYSIALAKGPIELEEVKVRSNTFRSDSIENQEVYEWAINHYKLEGMDVVQHPFDALSKRNRRIWAFQKEFQYFEKQKFIDYVFNDNLIRKITSIDSQNLKEYKSIYRPSYSQIKAWTTYSFYEYIQQTGLQFKARVKGN